MKSIVYLSFLALVLAGCEEMPSSATAPSSALPAQFDAAAHSIQFARNTDASKEARMEAAGIAMTTTFDIAATTQTWQDAHAAVQRAVESADSELTRSTIEQATAKMMLTGHLVQNADDPGAAQAALKYAERLVELRSPETEVVLQAVQTFQEEWPRDRTAEIATGAADVIDAYVVAGGNCKDCDRPADMQRALRAADQTADVWTVRQADAGRRLRAAIQ